jgi:hypothetical protein
MNNNPYTVEVNPEQGFVRIDRNGSEKLYWESTEFRDEHALFAAFNAVKMALTKPSEMDKALVKLKLLHKARIDILFTGTSNKVRCIQKQKGVLLTWRHQGKTIEKPCEDVEEAAQVVRATFPLCSIKYVD